VFAARLRITAPAGRDIAAALRWSTERFGVSGRRRYEILIATALRDIAQGSHRPAATERPDLGQGVQVYHLRHSRDRARTADGVVRTPRHFIVFRSTLPDVVVLRVLHDSMDLSRHLEDNAGPG
jgi:toxin ParE1/3/4